MFSPDIILQIESKEGINNMNSFCSRYEKQIYSFMLGPYDLSLDINMPGKFKSDEFIELENKYYEIISNYNIYKGTHVVEVDFEIINRKIDQNYNLIAISTDSKIIVDSLNTIK